MPVKRRHIMVEPKVTAFLLRREPILREATEEPHREAGMPGVAEAPLVLRKRNASRDQPEQHLPQPATIPSRKKRGRPRTGRTKENVTLSLNTSVINFLNSLPNQSETVNDLLLQSEEYRRWSKARTDALPVQEEESIPPQIP